MSNKLKKIAFEKFKDENTKRTFIIGEIMSDFIIIETALNEIITTLYVKEYMKRPFGIHFISDEQFSFALRKNIVIQTLRFISLPNQNIPEKEINKLEDELNKLCRLRNLIAHSKIYVCDIEMQEKVGLFDSKKGEIFDIEKKYQEFNLLFNSAMAKLNPILHVIRDLSKKMEKMYKKYDGMPRKDIIRDLTDK